MKPSDPEALEAELRSLRPAPAPEAFLARLEQARPACPEPKVRPRGLWVWAGRRGLRWAAPLAAGAAVLVALVSWRQEAGRRPKPSTQSLAASAVPVLKADDVEVNRRLVAAFDAIALLPSGEPVRFRCQEWQEEMVLRDSARGVEIERREPRLEIVPVSFETY